MVSSRSGRGTSVSCDMMFPPEGADRNGLAGFGEGQEVVRTGGYREPPRYRLRFHRAYP